tara:strand:- start:9504 stop:9932 length:429 start_codon:yes stop_codon:yes gene_type:complete
MEKYYQILGLPNNSSKNDITKKYRELSKKLHPDKGGNEYLFNMITESYNKLLNNDNDNNDNILEIKPVFNSKYNFFKDYFSDMDEFIDEFINEFDNQLLLTNTSNDSNLEYYSKTVVTENINGRQITKEVINDNGVITEKYY